MGDILVQEGVIFHTILQQKLQENIQRVYEIRKFSVNTAILFSQFSKNISLTCRQLFQKLKNDEQEDQNIIFMSKYIIDIMNQLSKKVHVVSGKIQNQIIEPLSQFIQNQNLTNKMILRQSEQAIYSLESNNQFLKELSRNFDINSKQSQNKSKQEKHEYSQIYEMEMERCNEKWRDVKTKCGQIIFKIDSYNSSRCNFTTRQQINLIKLINSLAANDLIEQSLTEFENLMFESSHLSQQIKECIRQKMGHLNLLEDKPLQIEGIFGSSLVGSFNGAVSNYSREKRIIDDFVAVFTSKTNIKEDSKDFQDARGLILDKIQWIKYFLNKMQASLHTQIHLPIVKYREITALIKYIFAHTAEIEEENYSILYSVLYISYRIRYNEDYLIKEFGRQEEYWRNPQIWFKIIEYVKKSKYSYKQLIPEKVQGYLKYGKLLTRQIWAIRSRGKQSVANDKKIKSQIKSEQIILDARDYDIMCEINYFMIKLELQEKFVFNFILEASERYNFSQQNMKKLIKSHYFNRISNNNKIGSTEMKRKKRLQKKYNSLSGFEEKLCICIGKSLQFLSIEYDSIVNLRRVCKHWSERLENRIYQRYLIHENTLKPRLRLNLYRQICKAPFSQEVYRRMVKQMPETSEHTQIIFLDAKRSLCWNEALRIHLMEVLGVYAFYHQDVGYLQGMNYLCENILKMTSNTFDVYSIFEHLMNYHYENMYTGKFDGLKIKIYQMMRIIQRENSQLYNHFQAEKIEGQHFLLSWAITLWGQMSGELCWILWDGFLVKGWKWWIKTCLWLLRNLEPELLKMNFQQIMKCFSDLGTSLFCLKLVDLSSYGIDRNKIKKQIDSIRIQSDILKDIQKEYQMKINTMNQFLKKVQNKGK